MQGRMWSRTTLRSLFSLRFISFLCDLWFSVVYFFTLLNFYVKSRHSTEAKRNGEISYSIYLDQGIFGRILVSKISIRANLIPLSTYFGIIDD